MYPSEHLVYMKNFLKIDCKSGDNEGAGLYIQLDLLTAISVHYEYSEYGKYFFHP
jgi:hypothetical protein